MNIVITTNSGFILVETNDLYPTYAPTPIALFEYTSIVKMDIQEKDGDEFIAVIMDASREWQLDNEGNSLGLPVDSINGVSCVGMTNRQLLTALFNNL